MEKFNPALKDIHAERQNKEWQMLLQEDWLRSKDSPMETLDTGYVLASLYEKKERGYVLDNSKKALINFFERLTEELKDKEKPHNNKEGKTILYQDEDLFIINKPTGVISHHRDTNPVGAMEIVRYTLDPNASLVHRLDKDTSGILVLARNRESFISMKNQFANKTESGIHKKYMALVDGEFTTSHQKKAEIVNDRMQFVTPLVKDGTQMKTVNSNDSEYNLARRSITYIRPIDKFITPGNKTATLLDIEIVTGMTHQIRVVLAQFLGLPIKGDRLYNAKERERSDRMMLHAYKLQFEHPRTKKPMEIKAPVDNAFNETLSKLTLI